MMIPRRRVLWNARFLPCCDDGRCQVPTAAAAVSWYVSRTVGGAAQLLWLSRLTSFAGVAAEGYLCAARRYVESVRRSRGGAPPSTIRPIRCVVCASWNSWWKQCIRSAYTRPVFVIRTVLLSRGRSPLLLPFARSFWKFLHSVLRCNGTQEELRQIEQQLCRASRPIARKGTRYVVQVLRSKRALAQKRRLYTSGRYLILGVDQTLLAASPLRRVHY